MKAKRQPLLSHCIAHHRWFKSQTDPSVSFQNDLTFLRVRSKKHEIMVAPGEYSIVLPTSAGLCFKRGLDYNLLETLLFQLIETITQEQAQWPLVLLPGNSQHSFCKIIRENYFVGVHLEPPQIFENLRWLSLSQFLH